MSETIYQKCAIRARDCIRKGKARHKDIRERHNVKKENGKDREIKKICLHPPSCQGEVLALVHMGSIFVSRQLCRTEDDAARRSQLLNGRKKKLIIYENEKVNKKGGKREGEA